MRDHAAVPVYFLIWIASALLLLKLSTQFLSVQNFAIFAQFIAFSSFLNMTVVAGAQNGLISGSGSGREQRTTQ